MWPDDPLLVVNPLASSLSLQNEFASWGWLDPQNPSQPPSQEVGQEP